MLGTTQLVLQAGELSTTLFIKEIVSRVSGDQAVDIPQHEDESSHHHYGYMVACRLTH